MPRGVAKANLPEKICAACKRPFTWRKKWERCWDEVQTCSNRCKTALRRQRRAASAAAAVATPSVAAAMEAALSGDTRA